MPTSASPHVARDLARLVESEALGEAFFGTAVHLGGTEQERRGWEALRDLEVQTNAGVSSFIERANLNCHATNRIASTAGLSGATGLRLMPYSTRLKLIRQGTKRYLPAFHRLAAHYSSTDEAPFFDYVVQHELAIISFTTATLAKERGALDPVLRLLDVPVPGLSSSG